MRATVGPQHKALLPVLGVPMIERNVCRVLDSGFSRIAVAVSAAEHDLHGYLATRARALAAARRATLMPLRELQPLGTIGILRELHDVRGPVVVLNGDNLTNLDLRAFVDHHVSAGAEMTIATHLEPLHVPYGEVVLADGCVVDYAEKPLHQVLVSSGAYVVEPSVAAAMAGVRRWDVPQLVRSILDRGGSVAAFRHCALWVDVNDGSDLRRCEDLVRANVHDFERWDRRPDRHALDLVLRSSAGVLAVRDGDSWRLPTQDCGANEPTAADAAHLWPAADLRGLTPLAVSDEVDVRDGGALVRHHVFAAEVAPRTAEQTWTWLKPSESGAQPCTSALVRALTYLGGAQ